MKTLLNITLFFSSLFFNAQDTIYFANSSVVSAKINEVGVSEIKYLRFDNLAGPNYTVAKTDIKKIRYSNGMVDTAFFVSTQVQEPKGNASEKTMVLVGTDIYYNGKIQGEFAMHRLISKRALSDNQIRIVKDIKKLKSHEKGYNALGTGLFVTGFAIPVVTTFSALGSDGSRNNVVETIVAGAITGAVFRIAGHVIAKIGKNKSKAKRNAFLKSHSQNEIIY